MKAIKYLSLVAVLGLASVVSADAGCKGGRCGTSKYSAGLHAAAGLQSAKPFSTHSVEKEITVAQSRVFQFECTRCGYLILLTRPFPPRCPFDGGQMVLK